MGHGVPQPEEGELPQLLSGVPLPRHVFGVVSARRVVQSTLLWNHRMLSMRLKQERSCFTTRRSYLRMEINGSQSWLRQLEQMRRIDKTELGVSFVGGHTHIVH